MVTIRHTDDDDLTCSHLEEEMCSCSCCRNLAQLEFQMLEGEWLLDQMAIEHQKLKVEKNRIHCSINKRMPPEILSTIFAHCVSPPEVLEYYVEQRHLEMFCPLMSLGNICRHWRDIAWSTPVLWRRIFFSLDSPECGSYDNLEFFGVEFIQEWLERSGGLPLEIYIRMKVTNDRPSRGRRHFPSLRSEDHPLIKIIRQYSHRWQDLYIKIWIPYISQMGRDVTELPLLRTFKIWPMGSFSDPISWNFQITPRFLGLGLEILGIHESTSETFSSFFKYMDWTHLTEVQVTSSSLNDCIQILKMAPQMTRFIMRGTLRFDRSSGSDSIFLLNPIVHSKVRHFKLSSWYQPEGICRFMALLHFPSLTELHYDVVGSDTHFTESAPFFERLHDLKSLSLHLCFSSRKMQYVDILRKCPSTTELLLIDDHEPLFVPPCRRRTGNNPSNEPLKNPILSLLASTYLDDATAEPSNIFPPSLRKLGFRTEGLFEHAPWGEILDTLGPLLDITHPRRRPLNAIHVDFKSQIDELEPAMKHRLGQAKMAGIAITTRQYDPDYEDRDSNTGVFSTARQLHVMDSAPW